MNLKMQTTTLRVHSIVMDSLEVQLQFMERKPLTMSFRGYLLRAEKQVVVSLRLNSAMFKEQHVKVHCPLRNGNASLEN